MTNSNAHFQPKMSTNALNLSGICGSLTKNTEIQGTLQNPGFNFSLSDSNMEHKPHDHEEKKGTIDGEETATIKIPLNIPDVMIEKEDVKENGDIYIKVKSTVIGTKCHKCGKYIDKFFGFGREITLRHLSIFGRKVYIVIKPPRYQCVHCNNNNNKPITTTQQPSWYRQRSPNTNAFEKHILLQLVNSTVLDISIKEDIGYEAVMGIIDRYINKEVCWDEIKKIGILGIDEISLKKGHKDYVVIVTALEGEKIIILGVLKDRKKETVKEFFKSMPKRLRKTIKAVCSDMYDGFINAAKEVFGKKVMVVIDRFHIAKSYRNVLDNVRKAELKRLKKELPQKEYGELKNLMWILRKNRNELKEDELKVLNLAFKYSPKLKSAYDFCNEMSDILDEKISKKQATLKIYDWIKRIPKSILRFFFTFMSTLKDRMEDITNYFVSRNSSGFVEGFNNKIKVIKRRCYGILNAEHLFQRIYIDLVGYERFT